MIKNYFIIFFLFSHFCFAASNLVPQEITMDEYKNIFKNQRTDHILKGSRFDFAKNDETFKGQFMSLGTLPDEGIETRLHIENKSSNPRIGIYNVLHDSGITFSQFILSKQANFPPMAIGSEEEVQKEKEALFKAIERAENSKKEVYGKLILGGLIPRFLTTSEKDNPNNTPDKKEKTRMIMANGALHDQSHQLFTTMEKQRNASDTLGFLWVMDKDGNLYIESAYGNITGEPRGNFHSFIVKSKKEGIGGKPIACGGDIKVNEKGKITFINNQSGHYYPSTDQFLLALRALDEKGVLDENVKIWDVPARENYTAEKIQQLDVASILAKYPKSNKQSANVEETP